MTSAECAMANQPLRKLRHPRFALLLAILAMLLGCAAVNAGEMRAVDLYSANVSVDSRAAGERRSAARQALQTVFARISGVANPASQYPGLGSALGRAERMVSGYSYQALDDGQLQLQFAFNQAAVRRALESAGAPWWSANRPVTEIWLVEQNGSNKRFVTASSNPQLYRALLQQAARVGIPVRVPAEQGDTRLSGNRAWQMRDADIIELVSRSNVDAALFGRVEKRGNSWRGQWKRYQHGQISRETIQARSTQAVASAGLEPLAQSMARRYAVQSNTGVDSAFFQLSVGGLNSPRDYLGMISALENTPGLSELRLLEISGSQCRFSFNFNGSTERARTQLSQNSRLVHSGMGDELSFLWRP